MAKKKSTKKHQFKYAAPVSGAAAASVATVQSASGAAKAIGAVPSHDFSYVSRDLRRVGFLAASLIVLEILLWYVFGHTGVGNTVYSWFQV